MTADNPMRKVHFIVGVSATIAFLASGAYLMFAANLHALEPGPRYLYLSRHIYMLGPALVHLILGVYVRPVPHPRVPRLQWTGTTLLVISSILLVSAFVFESVLDRGRTVVSSFGLFTFWAGAILHVIAARMGSRARYLA